MYRRTKVCFGYIGRQRFAVVSYKRAMAYCGCSRLFIIFSQISPSPLSLSLYLSLKRRLDIAAMTFTKPYRVIPGGIDVYSNKWWGRGGGRGGLTHIKHY